MKYNHWLPKLLKVNEVDNTQVVGGNIGLNGTKITNPDG